MAVRVNGVCFDLPQAGFLGLVRNERIDHNVRIVMLLEKLNDRCVVVPCGRFYGPNDGQPRAGRKNAVESLSSECKLGYKEGALTNPIVRDAM